jgi:hypothetical protein
LNEIDGFKDVNFFVKFTMPEFVESFLDGNLYMNTLDYFIELEKETKVKGQGDRYEGAFVFGAQNIQIIDNDTNMVIATAKSGMYEERSKVVREIPIFCFTKFTAKDFKVLEEGENLVSIILDIGEENIEKFLENFGSKAILLPGDIVEMMKNDADEQELDFIISPVTYHDYSVGIDSKRKKEYDNGSATIVTWKDSYFQYQREMRFAVFNKPSDKAIIVKIRNLREHANVLDAEFFLKNCYMKIDLRK